MEKTGHHDHRLVRIDRVQDEIFRHPVEDVEREGNKKNVLHVVSLSALSFRAESRNLLLFPERFRDVSVRAGLAFSLDMTINRLARADHFLTPIAQIRMRLARAHVGAM